MAQLGISADAWPAVSRRLDEALALTPAERRSWLEALDEPESVKQKLRDLMTGAKAAESNDFLAALPRMTLSAEPPDDRAAAAGEPSEGGCVGPYRLIRKLGAGGMGEVWLAARADDGMKRQVALKLPHLSWSRGLEERMRRERDILASLDHPNIAGIHDAGLDENKRPYLALEYVDGQTIDAYCTAHALPVRARLRLLLQVARAVAHAHARLIVHRDLKPANILVTAAAEVRLLDFGIAKLLEADSATESPLTLQVGRVLTVDYASPEQICGTPIGTASDIYSLGVVAYELLSGTKPYRLMRQSAAALEKAIEAVDVRAASTVAANADTARALKGDLDAILNKAMRKEAGQRYATVEAMVEDIERHLESRPVLARPDSIGYKTRTFLRRNKLPVAVVAAVALALLTALSMTVWQAREARSQADRAERVKSFLLSIFADADNDSEAGVHRSAADLLKLAQQRVNQESGGQPALAVELMTAIGSSMLGQGLMTEASVLLQQAVALSAQKLAPSDRLRCQAQVGYGQALAELGRNPEAVAQLQPCVESARRRGDVQTLNSALRWLSTAQFNIGGIEPGMASALAAVDSLSAPVGVGDPITPLDVMRTHQAHAEALGQADRPGAVAAATAALAAASAVYGSRLAPSVLDIRASLALAQITEGQVAEGLRGLDALVPATTLLLGPKHSRVSKIAHLVGDAKLSAGDVTGAIAAFRLSVDVEDASAGNSAGNNAGFDRGLTRFFLASALAAARRNDEALAMFAEASTLMSASAGPLNVRTLRAVTAHAWQLAEAGRLRESNIEFATLDPTKWSDADRASYQRRLAVLRSLEGRHDEALRLAQAANEILRRNPNKNIRARGLQALGIIQLEAGDAAAASSALQQARDLFAQAQIQMSPERAETLTALGRAQLELGDASAAVASASAGVQFWRSFDPTSRRAGRAQLFLAEALRAESSKVPADRIAR